MMRAYLYIVIFFALTLNASANHALADSAEKSYKNKQYTEAIQSYEALIKQGYQSDKLYYNLGNAYYRHNELGKAIYNFELAKKLNPSDEDIRMNLDLANSKTIDKIDSKTNFVASMLKSKLVHGLTTTQWAWASILALILSFLLLFLFFSASGIFLKRLGFFAGALLFIGFIISMIFGFIALKDKQQTPHAIILVKESKIYNEPQDSDAQKFSLHEGARLNVLETNGEWTSVQLENGNEGWVKTKEIGLF